MEPEKTRHSKQP